jgi:RNA polymerase primary sigma factor
MNYAKYRANLLRSELDPDRIDASVIEEIKSLVARAQSIRDHIIKANMRLVMSVVKKFVTPQHSFDDMLSEGVFSLMQAVEKFDYSRGFRFSTYAYRSIARSAYRSVTSARKEEAQMTRDAEDWAFEHVDDRSSSPSSERVWSKLREATASMLDRLDRRERFIVRSRYALGSHRKVKTFQYLADKLGVSKERVRQLEQRAVSKLQGMAEELETEEIFGAAMA